MPALSPCRLRFAVVWKSFASACTSESDWEETWYPSPKSLCTAWYLVLWSFFDYFFPAPPMYFTLRRNQNHVTAQLCAHHRRPATVFLLALPKRAVFMIFLGPPLPFIPLALNPLTSPELSAVPDLAYFFLPPNPNLASFLARLWLGALLPWSDRPRLPGLLSSLSTPTSKRSASLVSSSPPFSARSVVGNKS